MNSVETVLLENVDKPCSLFIFPTDVAASRWADHLLRLQARLRQQNDNGGIYAGGTVAMEKFIAWDTFKQNSIRSKVQNKKSVPSVLRKMFIAELIRENAQACASEKEPVFTSLIRPAWAQQADSYAGWLAGILSQLGIWFRQAAGLSIAQIAGCLKQGDNFSGDDRDMFNLALRYTQFLEKHGLFEPAWETPPFEDTGMECFIFFPESLSDFSEYRELLAASNHVKTIQADINEAKDSDVFFYTNARSEITEAALYIIALHENQNVPWDAISVSIPDAGNYGPYVFREFDNRNIPYVRQTGKPLASYPAGQFFAAVAGCSSENFSFASLTALLLNRHLPWNEDEKIQALIQFGIDNNCICSWTEEENGEEKKINVWEDAFENHSDSSAWLYAFFKKLTRMANAMRYAESFSEIRKHYFAFRSSFFDMEKCLDETDLVLSRCIAELNYLVEIENSYPETRVPDPYTFFTEYLEEISYLAQQTNSGVAILPYRTAAPAPFDCHIALGANQDSLSAVFSFLSFLPRAKREKLGISDNDASQAFITLHRFNSRLPAAFFCSEQTFSNYAIPHSALKAALKAEIKPRPRYRDNPEFGVKFAADLYHDESRLYASLHFPDQRQAEPQTKIHSIQKQGFNEWLLRRKRVNAASDSVTSLPFVDQIRNKLLYKGNDEKLTGKYGVSASSLESYYKCPLIFIFSRVLKLKNVEIETSLMANETAGIVYHKIINLFLEELKERGEEFATPSSDDILPKLYKEILLKKTEIVFDSFPYLSADGDNKPAMSMLTARLL
ncbi:MAG: PD-(D/E)XK nuclease family protein, partial [Treponema sp.]|nr:PD-(D/E)XK nuclease family protein [Treponema sp.]